MAATRGLQRYLAPRALVLLVVALALIVAMIWLGWWQLGSYDDQQERDARNQMMRSPVALDEALGADSGFPSASVGRPVEATGTYVVGEQLYVRREDGQPFDVVTPLVTDAGSAILVVRGSSREASAQAPSGTIDVRGVLQPSETAGAPLDENRLTDGIRIASLVPDVTEDLYAGYLILTRSAPADPLSPVAPPLTDPSPWAGIRNLLYAIQWWLFAGFVVFMWWRVVNDAAPSSHEEWDSVEP